jgi:hypothetical protein
MSNIFTLENMTDDFTEKINIDELYTKKQEKDVKKLELFNKILNRAHVKIKTTSRLYLNQHFCWFHIPEVIIGVPSFDQAACIAYIIDKLQTSKFEVKYYHPNVLFICWERYIPTYIRTEIKKKTGIELDEFGQKIVEEEQPTTTAQATDLFTNKKKKEKEKSNEQFKPIQNYKPTGKFIYDDLLFKK